MKAIYGGKAKNDLIDALEITTLDSATEHRRSASMRTSDRCGSKLKSDGARVLGADEVRLRKGNESVAVARLKLHYDGRLASTLRKKDLDALAFGREMTERHSSDAPPIVSGGPEQLGE